MKLDVLVVGAGPAGSIAGWEFARRGFDTLVVEKKQEIGPPKRCAEGVSQNGLNTVGIDVDMDVHKRIEGASLYSPSGKRVDMKGGEMFGYVLERKVFEKQLAARAIEAGAIYMVDTQAMGMERRGDRWTVRLRGLDGEREVAARLVIGADGVESKVGRWAGFQSVNRLTDYHSGIQYEMANVNVDDTHIHLFFGNNVAPLGYAWIFPKRFSANVGLGVLERNAEMSAHAYLRQFIDSHPDIFSGASPIEINAGGVPVNHFTEMVGDGVMLVGDAAQLVNPIHGGGIIRAMHSSQLAAGVAESALSDGDLSQQRLSEYVQRWDEVYEEKTAKLLKLRSFLEKLEDKDFELLADILEGEDIFELSQARISFFIKKMLKRPSLLGLARKYLAD
ncbi:MAG: geranylgeranyl reductase family protein [Thermoplasmatota archaeon]